MLRHARITGLVVGLTVLLTAPAPSLAQKFRNAPPAPPPPSPLQNNFSQTPGIIGYNTTTLGNGNNNAAANLGLNNNNGFNNVNQFQNQNQFQNPNQLPNNGFNNPYASPYGNPYAFNNAYTAYNFLASGYPVGGYTAFSPYYPFQSPAGAYAFNLNYQYLSNPYLNPLSNPAFSGPLPAGIANSTAALGIMGMGNILQNYPMLTPQGNGAPNNNNNQPLP